MLRKSVVSAITLATTCGGTSRSKPSQDSLSSAAIPATEPGQGEGTAASMKDVGSVALTFETSINVKGVTENVANGNASGVRISDLSYLIGLAGTENLANWKKNLTVGIDQVKVTIADLPAGIHELNAKMQIASKVTQTVKTTISIRAGEHLDAKNLLQTLSLPEPKAQLSVQVGETANRTGPAKSGVTPAPSSNKATPESTCTQTSGVLMHHSNLKIERFKDSCEKTTLKGLGFVPIQDGMRTLFEKNIPSESLCTQSAGTLRLSLIDGDEQPIEQVFTNGCRKALLQSIGFK